MKTKAKAQSIMEYTIVIGLVGVAVLGMITYGKRGIQVAIKVAADEIGRQEDYSRRQKSILTVGESYGPSVTDAVDVIYQDSLEVRDVSRGVVRERIGSFQEGYATQETYEGGTQDKRVD